LNAIPVRRKQAKVAPKGAMAWVSVSSLEATSVV
jgi:hypothetical protein